LTTVLLRRFLVALPAVGAFVSVLPAASGDQAPPSPIKFSVSVSRRSLHYGGTAATLTMTMTTGQTAERQVDVGLTTPSWKRGIGGSPLWLYDERMRGAGKIVGHPWSSEGPPNEYSGSCDRGGTPSFGVDVSLPAHSTSTLTYRVQPSWPSAARQSLVLELEATVVNEVVLNGTPTSVGVSYRVGAEHLVAMGARSVGATLTASHATAPPYPTVRAGRSTMIGGKTSPRLGHSRIAVGYISVDGPQHGSIGLATVNSHGAFGVLWKSVPVGDFLITGRTVKTPSVVLRDRCDLIIIAPKPVHRSATTHG
jgi:hypothetical protein